MTKRVALPAIGLGCLMLVCVRVSAFGSHEGASASDPQAKKTRAARYDDYQLPAGSPLTLRLRTTIGSGSSRAGDQIRAELPEAVNREDTELIPAGSLVHGKVVEVVPASAREPRGRIAIAFYVVEHARTGSRASIQTRSLVFEAPGLDEDRSRRSSKKQPLDVRLTAGEALAITLAKPLTVRIPR